MLEYELSGCLARRHPARRMAMTQPLSRAAGLLYYVI